MASPFPGMDPYLEAAKIWPDFHQQFVAVLYQTLLPSLVDRYRARVQTRHYVYDVVLFTSVTYEQYREPFIEIRSRSNGKLMTLVDVVSPGSRTRDTGRSTYLSTRLEALNEGAATVEIDLVLAGQAMLQYDRAGMADHQYAVTVTRPSKPGQFDTFSATLDTALPRFRLPLASDHQDTLVDLQTIFTRAYEQGDFGNQINYSADPAVPLDDAARAWLHDLLKRRGLR
ncbi:MAG: DUF4058 family protein [Gemmataceae bacterium]